MKLKFNGFLAMFLLLMAQLTFAQDKSVSGTVTDQSGLPLPGVNVLVKGSQNGTQTDFDGKFKVAATQGQTLVFSFTGMKTMEAKASNGMKVKMADDSVELEGVVVTALGIKRETKSLGYSSQKVSSDQVNTVPTSNFVNNLAGKVAGLEIRQGTNFGGSTNVVLRGYKSILGDNQALFVVDGVPILNKNINSASQKNGRYGFDYGNSASDINPNDIAEINVLKGAAATALYGSRAQNGAIIITTKKGGKNKDLSVEFSSSLTTSTVNKETFPEYQTEYGQGYLGQIFGAYLGSPRVSFGHDASYGPKYDNALVWQYDAFIPGAANFGQKSAWKMAENGPITFFQTGYSTVNNISFSGGSEKATYRFGYGNTYGTDIMPNSKLNKNNFSGNASYKLTDKLTANFSANYITQNTLGRNSTGYNDNIMSNFRQWWATNIDLQQQKELYNLSNQNYTWNLKSRLDIAPQYWDNPYFQRYENYSNDTRNRFAGNTSLSYDVTDNWNLMGRVGTDGYTMKVEERRTPGSVAASFGLNTVDQPAGYAVSLYDVQEQNYDFLSTYKRDLFKDLNLNLIVGTNFNVQKNYRNQQSTSGGLFIPNVFTISNSLSAPALPVIRDTRKEIFGVFGQASLGYKGTYYLEGSLRRDESSALPKDNNSYTYYSVSSSIVFSNWSFIKDSKILKFGKVRAAYAQVGSDTDPNLLNDVYDARNPFLTSMYSYNTDSKSSTLKPQRLDNVELGLNMQFLNNRLGFDVAWFQNKAFDQILPLPVSLGSGTLNQYQNAGTLETKGFEISLNATPLKLGKFTWDMNLNWSNPKTKVIELADGVENIQLGSLQGGISINAPLNDDYGSIWGTTYVYSPDGQPVIGDNGAYLISETTNNKLGTFQADWSAGLNNKFSYNNLSLSFLIDWKKGGSVFSLDQYYGYGTGLYPDSVGSNDLGFPIRNTIANNGGVILAGVMENPAYTPTNGQPQYINNTTRLDKSQSSQVLGTDPPAKAFVYDAGFVKLREVVLTYSLPSKILANSLIKNASFSLIGNNLWIIDKDLPYSDPEAGLSSGNVQGYQSGPMPSTKNISFNVKVNF